MKSQSAPLELRSVSSLLGVLRLAADVVTTLALLLGAADAAADAPELDRAKLDKLFDALDSRNEAMGSIAILRDGHVVYQRALGESVILGDQRTTATPNTRYRLASVTKIFTATMIFQLIEEEKITLATTLDAYYPEAPNAKLITIGHLLSHRSGLHDFTQAEDANRWLGTYQTHEQMVAHIVDHQPDFQPGKRSAYSNSNFLLLGYILETVDAAPYAQILKNRVTSKIGLQNTYYGAGTPNVEDNESLSYRFDGAWVHVPEHDLSNPAGAGAIVSTPTELAMFIDALFSGRLVAQRSLDQMKTIVDRDFGMGLLPMPFGPHPGFGHTGAIDASRSSVVYYPQDHLAVAYCTNGHVYRMEHILNHVASICFGEPFAVSASRVAVAGAVAGCAVVAAAAICWGASRDNRRRRLLMVGLTIPATFWSATLMAGRLHGHYSHVREPVEELSAFYTSSGTFMSIVDLLAAILTVFFLCGLWHACGRVRASRLPLLPILALILSFGGSALFPEPHPWLPLFSNLIIALVPGTLLAAILWRQTQMKGIRIMSTVSLAVMIASLGTILLRPQFPQFVGEHFGMIQRLLHLAWSIWFVSLSYGFLSLDGGRITEAASG